MKKLEPKCLKGEIGMAITNRGELLPCCRCDDPKSYRNDESLWNLMQASKIDEFDTIDEILFLDEWQIFVENLKNHKGPICCFDLCEKEKKEEQKQIYKTFDNGNLKNQQER